MLYSDYFDYVIKEIGFSGMIWQLEETTEELEDTTYNLLHFSEVNLDKLDGYCGFSEFFKINL